LSHHYRSPLDFSAENLREAEAGLERIYRTLAEIDALLESNSLSEVNKSSGKAEKDNGLYNEVESLISQFEQAMDDDFNTALALGYFHNMVRTLNRFLSDADIKITDARKRVLAFARTVFSQIGNVLGLFQSKPAEFLAHLQNQKLSSLSITIEEIEKLIAERSQARKEKNWKRADEIRAFLLQQNILLEDDRDKTTWKVK
jgi:cysteinyl-tRNA synthetase